MRLGRYFTRSTVLIIVVVLCTASAASTVSYEYSAGVSANIRTLSLENIHATTQIEASDIGHVVASSLDSVSSNLNVLANSRAVSTGNVNAAEELFDSAQNSTSGLTYTYFWLDDNGSVLLSSNGTSVVFPPGEGVNLGSQSFFTVPKETLTTFFSSATNSIFNSSVKYVFVSRPVFSSETNKSVSQGSFSGVVGASIELPALGSSLKGDLAPQFQSAFGLLDFKGTILYSANESSIGENVYSNSIQAAIPAAIKPEFDAFLDESLSGQTGYQDLSYNGVSATLAYYPILVNATTANGGQTSAQWGVLYITSVDTLGTEASGLVHQAQLLSVVTILAIAVVSIVIAFTVLRWNRRLDETVKEKTASLITANEELATKANAERDLMNITAHELRTPTQSILANTEILRRVIRPALGIPQPTVGRGGQAESYDPLIGDIDPTEMVELVEASYRNAQSLQRLTQNILEVARIDNKTLRLEIEDFDLNELVRETVEDMKEVALMRTGKSDVSDLVFSFEPKQELLMVKADRNKASEILTNLLDNAMRFSPAGGKITIGTDEKDGLAVVRVSDQGLGIDPEVLPKLFTKFGTKTGTGLGLYISKSYVEAQGGTIRRDGDSREPDEKTGATFVFTLPLASQSPRPSKGA